MSEPLRAVCVTGMHRSGTSAAARSLMLLGVDFGDPLALMGPGPDNPAGYWENRYLKELSDLLLSELGGSWDRPPVLRPGWQDDDGLDHLRSRAAQLLEEAFPPPDLPPLPAERPDGSPLPRPERLVGWKDPRLGILLPFWRTVVDVVATVTVVRDPREVAASLGRRNGTPPDVAALLWLRYVVAAAIDDPTQLVLDNGDLLSDPGGTLRRMSTHLGLPEPTEAAESAVREHLDPSLLHHHAGSAPAPDPVSALALDVYGGGSLRLDLLEGPVRDAIGQGWFRASADDAEVTALRAEVVSLTERLRTRSRAAKAAVAAAESAQAAADAARHAARVAIEVGERPDLAEAAE